MIRAIEVLPLGIPFKQAFKHASAARATTQAVWVRVRDEEGTAGCGEGCPREYVTGESLATAQAFIHAHSPQWRSEIRDVEALKGWVRDHEGDIDANPAAWCAVELALLDLMARRAKQPVEMLLGLPKLSGTFRYTAVIGDGPQAAFDAQLTRYRQAGLRDFKIKLAGDRARDAGKVSSLLAAEIRPAQVRADANNLWGNAKDALAALAALEFSFAALEEPLRAGDWNGMERIAAELGCRIILDESIARVGQLAGLDARGPWTANVRVSKMGGLLRSLNFVQQARRKGLRLIVGAHVGETSLLTRAALPIAMAAGDALVAQEGAFGTYLLERDVVERSLMFGPRGALDIDATGISLASGWGLAISEAL